MKILRKVFVLAVMTMFLVLNCGAVYADTTERTNDNEKYRYEEVSTIDTTEAKYLIVTENYGCFGIDMHTLCSKNMSVSGKYVNVYKQDDGLYEINNVNSEQLWSFSKTGNLENLKDVKIRNSNGMGLVINKTSLGLGVLGDNLSIGKAEDRYFISSAKANLNYDNHKFSSSDETYSYVRIFKQVEQ